MPDVDQRSRQASPNRVMALALGAALLLILAGGGLLTYAASAVNGITAARETRLMERSVERRLGRLRDDVASVCIWNDAYDLTVRRFDVAWAQVNYGTYFSQYLHHDLSVIVGEDGDVIRAWTGGKVLEPRTVSAFVAAAGPLMQQVRARASAKIAANPRAAGFDRAGAAQAAVKVGDRVYLVSGSTIVPEPGYDKPLLPGVGPVVLSAVEINGAFLSSLDADYGLKEAHLAAPAAARIGTPLRQADGATVATLSWAPERPGLGVFRRARWWILVGGAAVLGMVALVIWRLRDVAATLMIARDRAEAGDRTKSEFIANMSHEIRTPLNGVLGMAQAMAAHELPEAQRGRLKVIQDSGVALLAILNDVLDLAKIEAGKLEIDETEFTLEQVAQQLRGAFTELAAAKGLTFSVSLDAGGVATWRGDVMRVRQVLSNLISNALKFTERGAVGLTIAAGDDEVSFTVTDTGIGLSETQLPRLFGKFSQGDASTTRRYGGTGLGLSISRQLVELMGGVISVESRLGEGSAFTVRLPLRPVTLTVEAQAPLDESAPIQGSGPLSEFRILAAEDNAINRRVLRAVLEPLGVRLVLARNGREAVDLYAPGAFDLILMDIQMPELNGVEAVHAIRAEEDRQGAQSTPILALTANVMSHQVEAYLASGMDGCLAKPLDLAAFYAAIDSFLPAVGKNAIAS